MALSFSTALSGLRASSDSLSTTGNNIANANTTAFKSSTLSFADIYLSDGNTRVQIGSGVRPARTTTNFMQGGVNDSAINTHAAIRGNGFFVVGDASNGVAYTRAGDFTLDRDGYLVTPSGRRVQGYPATNGAIAAGAPLTDIKAPIGETVAPSATTEATLRMNLNSNSGTGSTFTAPIQVFDSKGVARTLNLTFTRQANGSFNVGATLDGNAAQLSTDGGAGAAISNVTFDSDGMLVTPTSLAVLPDQTQLGGATLPSVNIRLRETNPDGTPGAPNITNFSLDSSVGSTQQDGYPPGNPVSFTIAADGTLLGNFSNGKTRAVGQLAVATFSAQGDLKHAGDNLFVETIGSGQATVGAAGTGGRGEIVGGALEGSNVDISTEFTGLIVAQRSFQANSRVISTVSQTLQELLQIQ